MSTVTSSVEEEVMNSLLFIERNFQLSVESSVGLQLFCFSSLCNWSGNLPHSLNQSSAKLNPIMTLRFPAPFHSLVVFNLGSHWLLMIFSFSF